MAKDRRGYGTGSRTSKPPADGLAAALPSNGPGAVVPGPGMPPSVTA
jgi:hypothetical protein